MEILLANAVQLATDPSIVQSLVALVALVAMEIVLGIDNIVFIAIVTSRLPAEKQEIARKLGLLLALGMRIVLLLTIKLIMQLDETIFTLTSLGIPLEWLSAHMNEVSVKDLILLAGGLFLIRQSVHEMHETMDHDESEEAAAKKSRVTTFGAALVQIAMMDIIFSLDSVITAIGMVDADQVWVMILAIVIAVGVMMIFANPVSRFVENTPTVKILALSFLILIGVMLVAEGIGSHFDKNYVYFAMAFALAVEILNIRVRSKEKAPQKSTIA
jgi:predicted tellurium resistance membrane protein TerC